MKRVDPTWCRRIHERLLAGDPTAPAELAETLGNVIFDKLRAKLPRRDPDLIRDAAWDAIRGYLTKPADFDPHKRGLVGYLIMVAHGDALNALAKVRRRREDFVESVEVPDATGKRRLEQMEARIDVTRIRPQLDRLFPDRADRRAIELMLDGERSTEPFAEVWGFDDRSPAEKRKGVKRGKDRLKKALERLGYDLRGRER